MKKLSYEEIKDILVGCTILGTGGGSLDNGLGSVEKALASGCEFQLLDFDEIQDDGYYANPYYCGSIVPKGDDSQQRGDEIATSVKALEEFMGVKFHGLVSIEYGGGNTGEMMAAAARTGKFIVDADAAGRAQREAVAHGEDPIQAILKAAGGKLLFQGAVAKGSDWSIREGFTVGEIHISGEGAYQGDCARIWYKNENMMMWVNDNVKVTCPDLICVVETKTGYPITNPNCTEGMEVTVLGFHCHEIWKRPRGLEILNPRFFGFDCDCVFLED